MAVMRNPNGVYNNFFDVQEEFIVAANSASNILMYGRIDGGGAVSLKNKDLESIWDPYITLKGVDATQDLLFHNDFEKDYPDPTQSLHSILNDVFNVELLGLTNIVYTPPVWSPIVGPYEFKKGASFLSGIQELCKRAGYLFYVDDTYNFRSGAPGFSATPIVITSILNDLTNSIIDTVDLDERDGDKHYNYIELYGKNPQFDAYTCRNAADWTGTNVVLPLTDDTGIVMVGTYSIKATADGSGMCPYAEIDFWNAGNGRFNYSGPYKPIDFSKGPIGCWVFFVNGDGGLANAAGLFDFTLFDDLGNFTRYQGESTKAYPNEQAWIEAPLGEAPNIWGGSNEWVGANPAFNWKNIRRVQVSPSLASIPPWVTYPTEFYVDGLTMPIPALAIAENLVAQAAYRRRPFVDGWTHVRTQNALQAAANQILQECQSTALNRVKFTVPGDARFRYAGQSFVINIPSMGMNNANFYSVAIHHIVEPYSDVASGFGYDWVSEIEAIPLSNILDMGRLRVGPMFGATIMGQRNGIGGSIK